MPTQIHREKVESSQVESKVRQIVDEEEKYLERRTYTVEVDGQRYVSLVISKGEKMEVGVSEHEFYREDPRFFEAEYWTSVEPDSFEEAAASAITSYLDGS